MKIYKLVTNKVHEPQGAVISSFVSPRTEIKSEYFLSEEKAKDKMTELYKSAAALFGLNNGFEFRIFTVEVIE